MLVKFFATYRKIAGTARLEVAAPADVRALLEELCARWPAFRPLFLSADGTALGDDVIVLVSGRHVEHLDGIATRLTEADTVALTPLVAGG